MLLLLFPLLLLLPCSLCSTPWTASQYPDLRGASVKECAATMPPSHHLMYICDPDRILNNSQALWMNRQLSDLAVSTPCHCQRPSQCSTGATNDDMHSFHGFIVSVAIVDNLQMTIHSPSEVQLTERAESFCKALEGRWALGDCGNSVIVLVWQHYKKMIIWPSRLAEKYVTVEERKAILAKVNDYAQTDHWYDALSQVMLELRRELNGEAASKSDTGTLSLLLAVGVAVLLTVLITCCVCAFRCCGNLRSEERPRRVQRAVDRVGSLRDSVVRRGSQLRRSFSRSPKFAHDSPSHRFFASQISDTTTMV